MLEFTNEKLQLAKKLVDEQHYEKALEIFENFENINSLLEDEQYNFYLVKSSLYYNLGQYEKSLIVADEVLQKSINSENDIAMLDSFIAKAKSLLWFGRYEEFNEIIKKRMIFNFQ